MSEITQELVRELFDYRDGNLYWKVYKGSTAQIGDLAGTIRPDGYRKIMIDYREYRAHRLIFIYHHGFVPERLDHIDGDPLNNDIENLRVATPAQNMMNRKPNKHYRGEPTSSTFKGVTLDKRCKKWMARIGINGELKFLGLFKSEIEAGEAYNRAAKELNGEYAMLNYIS